MPLNAGNEFTILQIHMYACSINFIDLHKEMHRYFYSIVLRIGLLYHESMKFEVDFRKVEKQHQDSFYFHSPFYIVANSHGQLT